MSSLSEMFKDGRTDGWTDGPTDRPADVQGQLLRTHSGKPGVQKVQYQPMTGNALNRVPITLQLKHAI